MFWLESGGPAFLFAALNILERLYEACLERMQAFIDEGIMSQSSTGVPPVEQISAESSTSVSLVELQSGTGVSLVWQDGTVILPAQPGGTPGPQYVPQYFNPWAETRTHTRNLPHWEQEGATYFLTFRLADSLPQEKVRQWREERDQWLKRHPKPWNAQEEHEFHSRFTGRLEEYSDAGYGECWLRLPDISAIVENALRHFDGERYELSEYVIMPNHVHLLVTPKGGHRLREIEHSWKSYTAKEINKLIGRQGTVWQEESYDHIVRSIEQLDHYCRYIRDNPIKAGLKPGQYRLGIGMGLQNSTESSTGVSPVELESGTGILPVCQGGAESGTGILPVDQHGTGILAPKQDSTDVPPATTGETPVPLFVPLGRPHLRKYSDFRRILEQTQAHLNRRYFILKSIIIGNLFGVDIMEEAVEICKLRLFLKLVAQVEPDLSKENLGLEPLPDIDFNIRAGNTLVGFATLDEVKKAMTAKLDFDNTLARITERAEISDRAYQRFREMQIVHAVEADRFTEAKTELRSRLHDLEEELDRYLAGEYGVKDSPSEFKKWRKSHQPFHCCVEFYGIIQQGGFDVIVGNPPYLEYAKVKDYRILKFSTEACANLYAFTVERSLALSSRFGRIGLIVPISTACPGALKPLRDVVLGSRRSCWLSHYSNRPGQLFAGAQNRLTIILTSHVSQATSQFSTKYHRWNSREGERDHLFLMLEYAPLSRLGEDYHGLYCKVGNPLAVSVLEKIQSSCSLNYFARRGGNYLVFWVRVPGYFCQFLLTPPTAKPETGGEARIRGEVNSIGFGSKMERDVVHGLLNSSTYYMFYCAYTDTRHVNPSDVGEFPVDLSRFDDPTRERLQMLSSHLEQCYRSNTFQWRKSGLLIDSIDSKNCKLLIDEIDRTLSRHFQFTNEELDYIINYDIKYRMGQEAEET